MSDTGNSSQIELCEEDVGYLMIRLRKAEYCDKDLLFEWANDPAVRAFSFNTNPISYDVHSEWFDRMMNDETIIQFILMDGDMPIGQIRLNINGDEAEIGYSIDSHYRGKGYGHEILRLVEETVQEEYPKIERLIAKVKPENIASKRLFESAGYDMKYACFEMKIGGV